MGSVREEEVVEEERRGDTKMAQSANHCRSIVAQAARTSASRDSRVMPSDAAFVN